MSKHKHNILHFPTNKLFSRYFTIIHVPGVWVAKKTNNSIKQYCPAFQERPPKLWLSGNVPFSWFRKISVLSVTDTYSIFILTKMHTHTHMSSSTGVSWIIMHNLQVRNLARYFQTALELRKIHQF